MQYPIQVYRANREMVLIITLVVVSALHMGLSIPVSILGFAPCSGDARMVAKIGHHRGLCFFHALQCDTSAPITVVATNEFKYNTDVLFQDEFSEPVNVTFQLSGPTRERVQLLVDNLCGNHWRKTACRLVKLKEGYQHAVSTVSENEECFSGTLFAMFMCDLLLFTFVFSFASLKITVNTGMNRPSNLIHSHS